MSVLGFFDGDFKDWSVDLAGPRAQFPDKAREHPSESISDLLKLQQSYFRELLQKDPDRLKKMSVLVDLMIETRGDCVQVLSLDPRRIMNDDLLRIAIAGHELPTAGQSSLIAHTAKSLIHAGLSYDLFLRLKKDPAQRQTYLETVAHSMRVYREKHMTDTDEWPDSIADIVAANITHDIMIKMQKMRAPRQKNLPHAKSA